MYLAHPSCNADRGALAAPHIEQRKLIKLNKSEIKHPETLGFTNFSVIQNKL